MTKSPLLLSALGLLVAGPAQAGVTVVDASSQVPVVQAAVDAAANGDILLVQPGEIDSGSTITLDGKGLTLIAVGGTGQLGGLIVKNLPAGRQVTVRGFTLDKPALSFASFCALLLAAIPRAEDSSLVARPRAKKRRVFSGRGPAWPRANLPASAQPGILPDPRFWAANDSERCSSPSCTSSRTSARSWAACS